MAPSLLVVHVSFCVARVGAQYTETQSLEVQSQEAQSVKSSVGSTTCCETVLSEAALGYMIQVSSPNPYMSDISMKS
ncbi:hypothetical protein GE09DRAFT_1152922 [Coniochaeta sp. 2T2.1]|nr:hypothetical protein GE09DRAFT_1152922 [Coniochaeta sp. 2T2.1]